MMHTLLRRGALALAALLLTASACSDATDSGSDDVAEDSTAQDTAVPVPADYSAAGDHPVGHTTFVLDDTARDRLLTVEVWYPAAAAGATGTIQEFVADSDSALLSDVLDAAPPGCVNLATAATRDAAPVARDDSPAAGLPLLLMSHCHNCLRFSTFSLAERLASHGFVVAAPAHADNTLWDARRDQAVEISGAFLDVRVGDLQVVLDAMLDGDPAIPDTLVSRIDATRIGAVGHSYGSITAGKLAQDDPRIKAVAGLAAPMENPLAPGVKMTDIQVPLLLMVMVEDNSITEAGNFLIRQNFDIANAPAWKIEVADAGHWSLSDICGLVPDFDRCCGDGMRQTNGEPFTYLPVETGIRITQNAVGAFFGRYLLDEAGAEDVLAEPWPSGVEITSKPE